MNELRVRDLGLAAYIKVKGAVLLNIHDGHFYFSSDTSIVEWEVAYLNSCCCAHDSEVMSLKPLT